MSRSGSAPPTVASPVFQPVTERFALNPLTKGILRRKSVDWGYGAFSEFIFMRTYSHAGASFGEVCSRVITPPTSPVTGSDPARPLVTRFPSAIRPVEPRPLMSVGPARGVPAGTIIHTRRGGIPVEHLVAGDELSTPAGAGRVVAVRSCGPQPAVALRHQFGELVLAAAHPVAVFTGLRTWTLRPAAALTAGDRLVWDPTGYDGVPTRLPSATFVRRPHNTTGWAVTIPALDAEVAWLLGYFAGNGYAFVPPPTAKTPNGYVSLALPLTYPVNVDRMVAALRRFTIEPRVRQGDGQYVKVLAHSSDLAAYFQAWVKLPRTPLTVPNWIRDAPRDVRAAYLAGVFDADGSVKTRPLLLACSVYPDFLHALRRLYASLGIASEVTLARPARGNWQDLYSLTTRGSENRAAFARAVAPHAGKYGTVSPLRRSHGGFSFPTELVRATAGCAASWLVPGPRQTTARLTRVTGRSFAAYPVAVEAVTPLGDPAPAYDVVLTGPGELTAEGFVVAGRGAQAAVVRRPAA